MGQRIEHVLIDEFQDTSNEQWNILANLSEESLSKGGSLYYVGDKKQAIYGWRDGGDAKLFDTVFANSLVSNLVEEEEKKQEILGFNWRSTKEIVTFNNDFFSFLAESESVKDLVTKLASDASYALQNEFIENIKNTFYECSQAIPKKNEQLAGYVRFQKIPKEGKKSENQKEVLAVLEKLLKEELLPRRAYKDIAILVRDSTEAKIISAHLLALNIPVITENSLQLAQHPLIEQMLGFLAFIDYPMDNYAFVQFVIGEQFFLEEVGLTKNTIYEWILRQKKGKNYYKAFKEDFASIATRYIEPYYQQSGLMSAYDMVWEIVKSFHVLERHPENRIFVLRFLEIVHIAEQRKAGDLASFLDFWKKYGKDEKIPLAENTEAVRIMTIHKSKGLEFPVVIIPFHDWEMRRESGITELVLDERAYLVRLNSKMLEPASKKRLERAKEMLHLLYVAWTRPREELYGFLYDYDLDKAPPINFIIAKNENMPFSADGFFELGTAPQKIAQNMLKKDTEQEDSKQAECEQEVVQVLSTLKTSQKTSEEEIGKELSMQETSVQELKITNPEIIEPKIIEPMSWLPTLRVFKHVLGDSFHFAKLRGEAVHKAIELLSMQEKQAISLEKIIEFTLASFPALYEKKEELTHDMHAILEWMQNDKEVSKYIFSGRSEVEILDEEGNIHRIDHVMEDEKNLFIIEYKTGEEREEHTGQIERYRKLMEKISTKDICGVLVYVDKQYIKKIMK